MFELTEPTRSAVLAWIEMANLRPEHYLFPSRLAKSPHGDWGRLEKPSTSIAQSLNSRRPASLRAFLYLAPRPGLEPGTCGLTVCWGIEAAPVC
jgi:hypothetical protein